MKKPMNPYDSAIADLDARLERLQAARAVLIDLRGGELVERRRVPERRGKAVKASSGTGAVVLSAIRDGCHTVKAIAVGAKLKEFAARSAILALEKAKKVKREGKGSLTRYVAA